MYRTLLFIGLIGCGSAQRYVPGTRVPYSTLNQSVLNACEDYRLAVERGDADALMLMAHRQYWEDSGTPQGTDDYGYEGLRAVLTTRLQKASDIRYSLRYVSVRQSCSELHPPPPAPRPGAAPPQVEPCRAWVDILIDASFTITDALGKPRRLDKRDQNQLVLEWDGRRWLFLSGM
jgi:hypothetical protein